MLGFRLRCHSALCPFSVVSFKHDESYAVSSIRFLSHYSTFRPSSLATDRRILGTETISQEAVIGDHALSSGEERKSGGEKTKKCERKSEEAKIINGHRASLKKDLRLAFILDPLFYKYPNKQLAEPIIAPTPDWYSTVTYKQTYDSRL